MFNILWAKLGPLSILVAQIGLKRNRRFLRNKLYFSKLRNFSRSKKTGENKGAVFFHTIQYSIQNNKTKNFISFCFTLAHTHSLFSFTSRWNCLLMGRFYWLKLTEKWNCRKKTFLLKSESKASSFVDQKQKYSTIQKNATIWNIQV